MPTAQDIVRLLAFDPNTIAHVGATADGHIYVRLTDGSLAPLFTDAAAPMGAVIRADVATTANVTLSVPGGTHDGVVLWNGALLFVRAQSDARENGVYSYSTTTGALTRATGFAVVEDVTGDVIVVVTGGATKMGVWALDNDTPVTLDVDSLAFTFIALASGGSAFPSATDNQLLQYNGSAWVGVSDVTLPQGHRTLSVAPPLGVGTAGYNLSLLPSNGSAGSGSTAGTAGGTLRLLSALGGDGAAGAQAGRGGHVIIGGGQAGSDAGGGGQEGGSVFIDSGAGTGAAFDGSILIGVGAARQIVSGNGAGTPWYHIGNFKASDYLAVGGAAPGSVAGSGSVRGGTAFSIVGLSSSGGVDRSLLNWASDTLEVGNSNTFYTTLYASTAIVVDTPALQFEWQAAPSIEQRADGTNGITGRTFRITAQNATGTMSTGGSLSLSSGLGTSAHGAIYLKIGGADQLVITDTFFGANCSVVPTTNPVGGGRLYWEGGALKHRGSSGTVTTIAPA
jgi:hypothetical protein